MSQTILDRIAAERAQQDSQWGGPDHDDTHVDAEWRNYREKFERRADRTFVLPVDQRIDALVKIAALAVAQIESLQRKHRLPAEDRR